MRLFLPWSANSSNLVVVRNRFMDMSKTQTPFSCYWVILKSCLVSSHKKTQGTRITLVQAKEVREEMSLLKLWFMVECFTSAITLSDFADYGPTLSPLSVNESITTCQGYSNWCHANQLSKREKLCRNRTQRRTANLRSGMSLDCGSLWCTQSCNFPRGDVCCDVWPQESLCFVLNLEGWRPSKDMYDLPSTSQTCQPLEIIFLFRLNHSLLLNKQK